MLLLSLKPWLPVEEGHKAAQGYVDFVITSTASLAGQGPGFVPLMPAAEVSRSGWPLKEETKKEQTHVG